MTVLQADVFKCPQCGAKVVNNHDKACHIAYEKLSNDFNVCLLQKPIPDMIMLNEDKLIAIEYMTISGQYGAVARAAAATHYRLKRYQAKNSYDFVIVVCESNDFLFTLVWKRNGLDKFGETEEDIKEIISAFQMPNAKKEVVNLLEERKNTGFHK